MKYVNLLLIGMLVLACGVKKKTAGTGSGDTRTTPAVMLDAQTFLLTVPAGDPGYAFTRENPVKVGGIKENQGVQNEYRYLRALKGPDGQKVSAYRTGSCCPFKTPNGTFDNTGLLDRYKVWYEGGRDTFFIYINMYDKGDLKIPNGFTAKKRTAE